MFAVFEQPSAPFKYACSSFHSHQRDARADLAEGNVLFVEICFHGHHVTDEHAYTRRSSKINDVVGESF